MTPGGTVPEPRLTTVTSYGRGAGSARVRVFDWLDHCGLSADVHDYTGASSNSPGALLRHPVRLARAEAGLRRLPRSVAGKPMLLSRQATPFSNGTVERKLLAAAGRGVYDFDDALMHAPDSRTERLWSKRKTWRAAVEAADVVIAGNDLLAEWTAPYADRIDVIPSCVDHLAYSSKDSYEFGEAPRAVWLGSPSTERYLFDRADALLTAHRERGLRLTVISAGSASLGPLDRIVDRVTWTARGFAAELSRADLGIMPLDDSLWSRGKCAYKLLQYGAAGLPMVGDPVGANERVLRLADGLAAATSAEWSDALIAVVDESAGRRAERGARGRRAVRDHYSFAAWESRWRDAVFS